MFDNSAATEGGLGIQVLIRLGEMISESISLSCHGVILVMVCSVLKPLIKMWPLDVRLIRTSCYPLPSHSVNAKKTKDLVDLGGGSSESEGLATLSVSGKITGAVEDLVPVLSTAPTIFVMGQISLS